MDNIKFNKDLRKLMATSRRCVSLQQRNTEQEVAEETADDLNLTI